MEIMSREALKSASISQLKKFCEALREEIFQTVAVRGGHLASNLGIVELTIGLHRVFSFPEDKIIFDVGHQCYVHKLLTGRANRFFTLRQRHGISGFPKRTESEYDSYDTGHAGTSVSAALGFAKARDLKGEKFQVIALIGDGSLNNGLIYEALNSLKILNTKILIVLNDNGMSISPTVGGTHEVLEDLKGGSSSVEDIALFERYGLQYMGVYNANNLEELLPALEQAKSALQSNSVLLHVTTRKGQGYAFCERDPDRTHGISPAKPEKEYSMALGEELLTMAKRDNRVVAVTAAMTDALGLRQFFERYPERAFDVGICEEHASVLSAALAAAGMRPYYAIYSTFLQRAFDEIIHDVCGQKLPVVFCIDRAGTSGSDGETHQGVFDLSYLSMIPNLVVAIPKNIAEFRAILRKSISLNGPLAIRYPREGEEGDARAVEFGKFEVLQSTMSDIIIYAAGERCINLARRVMSLAFNEGISVSLVNACFAKPLDYDLIDSRKEKYVITIEDNVLRGGIGEAIAHYLCNSDKQVFSFGCADRFIPHGSVSELMEEFGPSQNAILNCIRECYARG